MADSHCPQFQTNQPPSFSPWGDHPNRMPGGFPSVRVSQPGELHKEERLRLWQTQLGRGTGDLKMEMRVFAIRVNLRDPNRQEMRNFQRKVAG